MTTNVPHQPVLDFIRGSQENLDLALLIVEVVAKRKEETKKQMIKGVKQGLLSGLATWEIAPTAQRGFDRWILRRKSNSDWSRQKYAGVWFTWAEGWQGIDGACGLVGVEWPKPAPSSLNRGALRELFTSVPEGSEGGVAGDSNENAEWFALCPGGSEWVGWANLLTKSNGEIKQFASEVAIVMTRLAEEIDRLDP